MPKFRKKPVVIEAWQFTGHDAFDDAPDWLRSVEDKSSSPSGPGRVTRTFLGHAGTPVLLIYTLEGTHTATLGDWIIKGVKGELYPCKADIFEATYEPV